MGAFLLAAALGCDESRTQKLGLPPPEVVKSVSLEKYAGTWFEIARLPNRFQKGCSHTTATYTPQKDGKIGVKNSCRKIKSGQEKTISGSAKVVDETTRAKLKVTFLWPLTGDYWILDLADDYSFAAVGTPDRNYLWILSRNPEMKSDDYARVVSRMKDQGFGVEHLIKTEHDPQ
jgi:apolipoprotein D and lipocalin family protein